MALAAFICFRKGYVNPNGRTNTYDSMSNEYLHVVSQERTGIYRSIIAMVQLVDMRNIMHYM